MKMKTITRSAIKLSEIPKELRKYVVGGHSIHTYLEVHIGYDEDDPLTLWLIDNYPTIKRKVSFFIHIDI